MTANLNEDLSGGECQLDSTIQGTSKGVEKEKGKTNRNKESQEWKVEKILNKRKINKYLVRWKGFTAEQDIWEKKENLENAKKALEEFEG